MPSVAAPRPRQPRAQPALTPRRKEGLRSWPLELPDHAACWFSAAWSSVTPERVRMRRAASKTNAGVVGEGGERPAVRAERAVRHCGKFPNEPVAPLRAG
jgi:hypothetical protein